MKELSSILHNIYYQTSFLEACDWDEDECNKVMQKLSEYFTVCTKKDLDLIRVDLQLIFSDQIADLAIEIVEAQLKGEKSELRLLPEETKD